MREEKAPFEVSLGLTFCQGIYPENWLNTGLQDPEPWHEV